MERKEGMEGITGQNRYNVNKRGEKNDEGRGGGFFRTRMID